MFAVETVTLFVLEKPLRMTVAVYFCFQVERRMTLEYIFTTLRDRECRVSCDSFTLAVYSTSSYNC